MSIFKEKIKIIYNVIRAKQYFFASVPFKGTDADWSMNNICCISADECTPIFLNCVAKMSNSINEKIKNQYELTGTIVTSRDKAVNLLKDGVQIFINESSPSLDEGYVNINHDTEYSYKYRKGILYEVNNENRSKEISWSYFGSVWHDTIENKKYVCYCKHYIKK